MKYLRNISRLTADIQFVSREGVRELPGPSLPSVSLKILEMFQTFK